MAVARVSKEELKQRLDGAAGDHPVLVDVRLKYPYEHSTVTLPGAVRMRHDALDPAALPRDRDVVFYDSDPDELVAERAAADLARRGFRAFVLAGGIGEWVNAKLPTDSKPAPQPAAPPGKPLASAAAVAAAKSAAPTHAVAPSRPPSSPAPATADTDAKPAAPAAAPKG
jgi:rhodanese-related sulfurtransferase